MYREYSDLPVAPPGPVVDRAQRTVRLAATAARATARPQSAGRLMVSGLAVKKMDSHAWEMKIVVTGIGV